MRSHSTKLVLICFAGGAAALESDPAAAAQQAPDPAAHENGTAPAQGLQAATQEIIVTARRRREALEDTPIAISAFSQQGLEYRGISTTEGLTKVTPNLTLQNNPAFGGSANSAAIYIRGIGQQDFLPTVDPGVGVYVDGVYIARSIGSILDLVDFERVEVLRGPQGTLFGRNTIGGAISITTNAPSPDPSASGSVTYGTDNWFTAKGTFNVPLSKTLFIRASVGRFSRDGYVHRTADGVDLGNTNRWAGRFAVRWKPSDWLHFDLALDGTRARENGPAITLLGIAYGTTVDPNTPPFVDIHNIIANIQAGGPPVPCATAAAPLNLAVPNCFDNRYVLGRSLNAGTAPSFSNSDIWGASLTSEASLSDHVTLKSITAYRRLKAKFSRDGDGSPLRIAQYFDNLSHRQYSEELQLAGSSLDNSLKWILGAYYFREKGENINLLDFTISRFQSGGAFDNRSLAGFGQATWDVTRKVSLTAGVRYTADRKSFTPDQLIFENYVTFLGPPFNSPIFAPGTRILPNVKATRTFNELTPMVNAAWKPTPELMTYVSYSRGFKSGGFTQRVFPPIIPGVTTPETDPVKVIPSFGPEKVSAYEAGAKLYTKDHRLRLNGAIFYNDYKDLQIQVFTGVAPVFQNAASAAIKGFELEGQLNPGSGWLAEGAVGYTDAHYNKIDEATTFVSKNNAFERISKWTASASLSKDIQTQIGTLTPRVSWSYRSRFFNNTFNTPQIMQPGYQLVDASLALRLPGNRFTVRANANDILDKHYLISGVYGDAFQTYEGVYNRGREFSVTLDASF